MYPSGPAMYSSVKGPVGVSAIPGTALIAVISAITSTNDSNLKDLSRFF
jgi:hypothetical protein